MSIKKPPQILLIEDEQGLRQLIAGKISKFANIIEASKVSESIIKIKNQKFDLIILDLHLEDGSGESVIKFVREDKKNFNFSTPILIISGHLDNFIIEEIRNEINGVLVKPFDTEQLVNRIKNFLPNLKPKRTL